ncbi:hypothetical protein AW863_RS14445 [Acinetobacter baumannii]|uniref:hypothetical protein n=1 Tax=Acinetobacter baumannii TaxID=470 RepID=UPI000B4526F3|nr:hypothetical protein [Acinetobacter baumannii]AVI33679.1 hypothetical protein CSB70_2869 [Acinetobacter baumannii]AVI36713.1 hypothetical protein CSB68_0378 [Acinetobacter baumannii]EHU1571452.1 hypothetical protein [Acinetobacter baumannii]EHU1627984.1 hypothetical protein [Acinetobacter baumannii]EHU1652587.1 hypothetical protein [Acinetobacter baumannii]
MSKVIGEVNLNPSRIEGTPDQVAIHIFKEVICPSTEELLKNNPEAAKVFAYHIFGLALSQLAEFHSTKSLDKSVSVTLHNLVQQLKKERNELKN